MHQLSRCCSRRWLPDNQAEPIANRPCNVLGLCTPEPLPASTFARLLTTRHFELTFAVNKLSIPSSCSWETSLARSGRSLPFDWAPERPSRSERSEASEGEGCVAPALVSPQVRSGWAVVERGRGARRTEQVEPAEPVKAEANVTGPPTLGTNREGANRGKRGSVRGWALPCFDLAPRF